MSGATFAHLLLEKRKCMQMPTPKMESVSLRLPTSMEGKCTCSLNEPLRVNTKNRIERTVNETSTSFATTVCPCTRQSCEVHYFLDYGMAQHSVSDVSRQKGFPCSLTTVPGTRKCCCVNAIKFPTGCGVSLIWFQKYCN